MTKWIVDDSNNGDFRTIAEAIAAAEKGDEIIVTGGDDNIHNEADIVINKELVIKSDSNGATIDAQGVDRVFLIDDGDDTTQLKVELKDLIITGGNAEDLGGGILNSEKLTVKNTIVTGNTAQLRGGGIYNLDGELKVKDSVISENISVTASGGGISNTGKLKVENSIIENNSASAGGGIANTGEATIKKSTISGHTSSVGAGIFNYEGELKVKESIISNNNANVEGGGVFNYYGELKVEKSTITGNNANADGGGILDVYGTTEVKKSTITGNTSGDDGGAIFVYGGTLEVDQTLVSGNYGYYGAITSQFSDTTITNSEITNNEGFIGGGITNFASNSLLLSKNDFDNNTSEIGNSDVLDLVTFTEGTPDDDNLVGTSGNNMLIGLEGNDTIDGQGGDDIIFGDAGDDIFVVAANRGMDVVVDFTIGEDLIGLSGGLDFNDLTFSDNTINSNGETLVVLSGIDTATLTSDDFTAI